jgi:hypothetical protein
MKIILPHNEINKLQLLSNFGREYTKMPKYVLSTTLQYEGIRKNNKWA